MSNRPVRFRGREYPVLQRFRIGGRQYLAVEKIGSSGRQAFKVFDPATSTMRALHVLPNIADTLERVRTLQRLTRGDNEILQIIECRREADQVWVVLPWIEGFNLRVILQGIREQNRQRIATPEALRLMKGVAHALSHLHKRKQIIHGDVKPANLLLTKRTSLVLIDYGNAWRIERTSTRSDGDGMSGAYSSPEFLRGEGSVNFRADIFSVGVICYELLTSKIPYDGLGGKAGLLPATVQSGLELVPASELSPECDRIPKRTWQQIDHLLASSLALNASSRFDTTSAWLDAWNATMTEVYRSKSNRNHTNFVVKMLDWIASRFARR